jgi:hypothetical protein
MMSSTPTAPLLTVRAATILLIAVVIGLVAGFLAYKDKGSLSGAVLWGGGTAGASILLFHSIIS